LNIGLILDFLLLIAHQTSTTADKSTGRTSNIMNITSEKQPHDVEMRPVESPNEQLGETYAFETRDKNRLFRWAYLLDDKVSWWTTFSIANTDMSSPRLALKLMAWSRLQKLIARPTFLILT